MKYRFYLAASFAAQGQMRAIRDRLVDAGHEVTSTWIDQTEGPADNFDVHPPEVFMPYILKDLDGIAECDIFVVFTDEPSTTGGHFVEFGYAMALGKMMVVVGPRLNIFHCNDKVVHYSTDLQFLGAARMMRIGDWG